MMTLDCLQIHPRPDLFYPFDPIPTSDDATMEVWTRFDRNAAALVYGWTSGENGDTRRGALRLKDGKLILLSGGGDSPPGQQVLNEEDLGVQDGQWHHLALVFEYGRVAVYRDGNRIAHKELPPGAPLRMERCGPTMWGARQPGSVALMHAARVWGRALSEREVLISMRSPSAPGFAGLVFESRLADGVLTNLVTGLQLPVTGTASTSPPDFAQARADDDIFVIEDLDMVLTQDMLPTTGQDISIIADTLTLSTALSLKGININVFARILTVNAGGSIDLSGAPGDSQSGQAQKGADGSDPGSPGGQGTAGAPGNIGQTGGNLILLVGTLTGQLPVTSNGGNGGTGQDGGPGGAGAQGATGGDAGGWAGDGTCGSCNGPSQGAQGGDGGTGGEAGPGGNGGNGGLTSLALLTPGQDGLATTLDGGQPGQEGSPGAAGQVGPGGLGGLNFSQNCDPFGLCSCFLGDDRAASGPPGNPGSAGGQAAPAQAGPAGTPTGSPAAYSDYQAQFTLALAHRVLHKAELSYFNSDFPSAATLLSWLTQAVPAGNGAPTDEWTCFAARVATLVNQMQKGLNYYGMPSSHVPLADAAVYLSTLQGLITAGASIEADYNFFTNQNNDQQSRIARLQNQLNGVADSVTRLKAAIQTASALEAPTNTDIAALNQQVLAQADVLQNADLALQNALMAQAGCTVFQDLLTAVKGIAAVSGGDWTSIGSTGIAIKGLLGGSSLPGIVQQIPTITYSDPTSMAAIRATWNGLQSVLHPPAPAPPAPDAGKMAITLEEFDALMQPYLSLPAAVNYLLAMHTYVGLTQAYNQKILTFDALVVQIAQLNATIALKQAESNRVSLLLANAANQDPGLPDYVAYMEGVYQDMLTLLLRYLFQANAALDYYTLNQTAIQVGTAGQPLTMADISAAYTTIATTLPDYINGSSGPQQAFDSLPVTLSAAPPGSYPPNSDPFTAFIQGSALDGDVVHTFPFSVPLDPNPLPGLYQLVGTAFTVSVPGFVSTSSTLMTRLTHSGRAPFLDATAKHVEFSHTSEEVFYAYKVDSQGNETKTAGGSLGGGTINPNYIGLSPCTAWTLEIRASENPGLDLSAVEQVDINFSGVCSLTSSLRRGASQRPREARRDLVSRNG